MSLRNRFQGRETQFHIELLYGVLFIAGFGYLAFRVDPRVAAFEGGLVVGYLLRVWEKMSIYERILEEAVSREAEQQVEAEVEAQVEEEVATELEDQVDEEVREQIDEEVADQIEEQVSDAVADEVDEAVGDATGDGQQSGEPT
ncbi:MAG: hypothetical protein ABEJ08_04945 [Halobacteriaceae archaeon]